MPPNDERTGPPAQESRPATNTVNAMVQPAVGLAPDVLTAALTYAAAGWPVHPCSGKIPLTYWRDAATTDTSTITTWWTRWPYANVAIPTGGSAGDVLDIDVKAGRAGAVSLARLREAGLITGARALVRTPSGGLHYWFAASGEGNHTLAAAGVDYRGAGGYVLVPPSTVDGRAYEWISWRAPTGTMVDWPAVRRLLDPRREHPPGPRGEPTRRTSRRLDALIRYVQRLRVGNRNAGLYWAACRAIEEGHDLGELVRAAVVAGLPEPEARRTAASASRRAG